MNVNDTTFVHHDFRSRKRKILVKAWAQTISAYPRNKKRQEMEYKEK